nr:prealbumin-like fold domain-containing protein [uncultured Dubosiella sp.]
MENAEFYLLNSNNESGEVYAKTDAGGKLISWTTKKEATVFKSTGKNGEFEIQGLDAGTYYLKEIKAPVGYNIMDNLQPVVVEANKVSEYDFIGSPIQNDQSTNDESSNESVNDAGVKNVTVYNGKGFTMPSTGAFGQTLIYGVGGLLALGGLGIRMARRRHEQD